ncbi:MAG: hypothetical protein ACYCQJ_02370 [Nitrososphaerales archaeon]
MQDIQSLPNRALFLRLLRIGVALDICILSYIAMVQGGIFSREGFDYFPGIHWYAVLIFCGMFLAYAFFDNIAVLLLPVVALVYYSLHEGIFNAFFLTYHGLRLPSTTSTWYFEMALIIVTSVVFLPLAYFFKDTLTHRKWWSLSWKLWLAFLAYNLVWVAAGFPVTVNVFNLSQFASMNQDPIANLFELGYNALFSVCFFFTFAFNFGDKLESSVVRIIARGKLASEQVKVTSCSA